MTGAENQGQTAGAKASRSIRNYALQPLLQVKLGLYSILMSMVFAAVISGILYINLAKFSDIILQLTGVEDRRFNVGPASGSPLNPVDAILSS